MASYYNNLQQERNPEATLYVGVNAVALMHFL